LQGLRRTAQSPWDHSAAGRFDEGDAVQPDDRHEDARFSMKMTSTSVLVVGAVLFASPALAQQYYPPTPPPPPPAQYSPPPQPVYYQPPPPPPQERPDITVRASGGVSFIGAGYFCGYYYHYGYVAYSCGAGYSTAFPNVNLDVDVWVKPTLGVSLGANVMWGSYTPYYDNTMGTSYAVANAALNALTLKLANEERAKWGTRQRRLSGIYGDVRRW